MTSLTSFQPAGASDGPRRFVVNLHSSVNKATEVRSCEIKSRHFNNRTSFSQKTALDEIFVQGVADAIRDCLGKLSKKTEVVSLPSFLLEVPGLILASAVVMSSEAPDGSVSIILRFKFAMGGVNRAFRPEIGFDGVVDDQNAHLAASVLADISLPLLNFCTAAELGVMTGDARVESFIRRLKDRSDEIKFQIELVKRFVDNTRRDADQVVRPAVILRGSKDLPRLN